MDGIHDLGGIQGFGKVAHTINTKSYKPVFHDNTDHLAYSLLFLAAGHLGTFSLDELRHAIERMDMRHYFASPYYDRINVGTASLLVEYGVLTQQDLDRHLGAEFKLARRYPVQGRPAVTGRAPFEVGDRVIVRDEFVAGHIRMPGYVRGKQGVVLHRTTEKWPLPDTIGHGDRSAVHQPTYHVQFKVKDLWGDAADDGTVVVDLFESYLDKATVGTSSTPVTKASTAARAAAALSA